MTSLRMEVGGTAVDSLMQLGTEVGPVLQRGQVKVALGLGAKVAENIEAFKETAGTRRLSRSFLTPVEEGSQLILGADSPVYAAIHEYGGKIVAKHSPYLVFETPDGEWHSVKEVHITAKHYARDAIEEFEAGHRAESILAAELEAAFPGGFS